MLLYIVCKLSLKGLSADLLKSNSLKGLSVYYTYRFQRLPHIWLWKCLHPPKWNFLYLAHISSNKKSVKAWSTHQIWPLNNFTNILLHGKVFCTAKSMQAVESMKLPKCAPLKTPNLGGCQHCQRQMCRKCWNLFMQFTGCAFNEFYFQRSADNP